MGKSKILVLYPQADKHEEIIKKANIQNKKNGPFDAVLWLGNQPLPKTEVIPEAPTYFYTLESSALELFSDVSENLIQVNGPFSVLKLPSGVKIAFLTGPPGDNSLSPVDIIVSDPWPEAVARKELLTMVGDSYVDDVIRKTKPRYHFATGKTHGKFFENDPIAITDSAHYRFVSLAEEGLGQRWFYAFSVESLNDGLDCEGSGFEQFFRPFSDYLLKDTSDYPLQNTSENFKRCSDQIVPIQLTPPQKKQKLVSPQDCFFCLSNPKLESHMVVAIGEHSYLAVAKGPMPLPQKPLEFSGHLIIIPIDHVATIEDVSTQRGEMNKFLGKIAEAYLSKSFALIAFEIFRPENVHFHIQLMPVPLENVDETFDRALAERTRQNNEKSERNQKLDFDEDPEKKDNYIASGKFIRFSIYSGKTNDPRTVVAPLSSEKPVDLQFPRRVMAFHLKCPKRTYWNRCTQTMGQESDECNKFKEFFRDYDFTINSD